MENKLEQLKDILLDLQASIFQRDSIKAKMDKKVVGGDISPLRSWEEEKAYCWIYATDHYYPFLKRNKFKDELPSIYLQPAHTFYQQWLQKELDVQLRGSKIIPQPHTNEGLQQYLYRLQTEIIDNQERRTIWRQSLRSFTEFLRTKIFFDEQGYLEVVFPKKMALYSDTIIRLVPPEIYPIDVLATAEIVQTLIRQIFEGRPNAQASAAQTLGLVWVCVTAAREHLLTQVESVHELYLEDLKHHPQPNDLFLMPSCHLSIPSLLGTLDLPISNTLYEYLKILSGLSGRLFEMPLRSLRRTLDRAITLSPHAKTLGNITFLTLMSFSHWNTGHRYAGLKKSSDLISF